VSVQGSECMGSFGMITKNNSYFIKIMILMMQKDDLPVG